MSERYFIKGTQIGMLHAFFECGREKEGLDLLREIEDKQFIGNIYQEDRDKLEVGIIERKGKVIITSTPKGNTTFEKELKKYKIDNNLKLKDDNILLFKNQGEVYILIKLKDFERII